MLELIDQKLSNGSITAEVYFLWSHFFFFCWVGEQIVRIVFLHIIILEFRVSKPCPSLTYGLPVVLGVISNSSSWRGKGMEELMSMGSFYRPSLEVVYNRSFHIAFTRP